ncbi:hypothetical protein ACFFRR_006028 [Megaselia abdita]
MNLFYVFLVTFFILKMTDSLTVEDRTLDDTIADEAKEMEILACEFNCKNDCFMELCYNLCMRVGPPNCDGSDQRFYQIYYSIIFGGIILICIILFMICYIPLHYKIKRRFKSNPEKKHPLALGNDNDDDQLLLNA